MVATYTAHHLLAREEQRTVIWQPADAATAQLVDLGQPQGAGNLCLPIGEFRRFHAQVTASLLVGTGAVAFSIYAATSAAGAGGVAVYDLSDGSAARDPRRTAGRALAGGVLGAIVGRVADRVLG